MTKHSLGCIPDTLDQRDKLASLVFAAPHGTVPPSSLDLRSQLKVTMPIDDQGQIGSCTAHGTTAALRFDHIQTKGADELLSRLQLYYSSRAAEGTVDSDAGAQIRDVIKVAAKVGVAPEPKWPYVTAKFTTKPPAAVFTAAKKNEALEYARVDVSLIGLKEALYSAQRPVVIGISVYESFESDAAAKTGIIPMPKKSEQLLGGHCMLVMGYDDAKQTFLVRNSWGASWGDKGYCHIPYAYLGSATYGADYWVVKTVTF